jgi:hypothetical protein
MALNRITGLGMIVLGSCMLYAACDSGGTTANPGTGSTGGAAGDVGGGGNTGGAISGNTGGSVSGNTGGAVSGNTGGNKPTGGSSTASSQRAACVGVTPPTATGSLSVSAGYVTAGSLKGYGFTWVGDQSNSTTCVTPTCDTTGCTPTFGATALCGAGTVTADTTYNSVVGIGFNFNQGSTGGDPGTVAAPATITVTATLGSGTGDSNARIQVVEKVGTTETPYCVASWTSGTAISIGDFNTKCWDGSGTALSAGATLSAIDIVIPSDSTADRPYSVCLTGVTF